MDECILEFATLLRRNGIRVSTPEILDSFQAVELVSLDEQAVFRQALCASLIKESRQVPLFHELFDAYFFSHSRLFQKETGGKRPDAFEHPGELQTVLDRLRDLLEESGFPLSPLARSLLFRDPGRLARMIREAAGPILEKPVEYLHQSYQFAFQTQGLLEWGTAQKQILELIEELKNRAGDPGEEEQLIEYLQSILREFPLLLREFFLREFQKQDLVSRRTIRRERLYQVNFVSLTQADAEAMNEVVHQLAEKLKTAASLRRRIRRRGRLQVRSTLRKNLQSGGVLFRLSFDEKKIAKPQIVILCDVSNSMRSVSRFMLHLVYSLQGLYSRVRSFLFVSGLGEATELFREYEINEAISLALSGSVVDVWSMTDYGNALEKFYQKHLSVVDSRTIFIILGDARSNFTSPEEWVLHEVKRRARMLIWLNPESPSMWGSGDSVMDVYSSSCDLVRQVANLKQLTEVAEEITAF